MKRLIEMKVAAAWAFAGVGVLTLIASLILALSVQASNTREATATAQRIAAEGVARRDETCRLFERQEMTEVTRVIRTYAYLDALPRSEWGSNFTKAIVTGMKAQREDAEAAAAPSYCNEAKGAPLVGLPETVKYQPTLPPKRDYSRLLSK